ncbi:alpha/beta fold hydrolase [Nonomuraea sp. NPDC050540]|uniref:alpha/beta fold hydrolase n=1 Tax=Nonomuraea sp. NPDC050540 TaxID=3364367 RepID=UPI00379F76D3
MYIAHQVRGGGEPLVLLAGQSNSHLWWESVREDFETRHTTITLDWLGTGDSDKPDVPYSTRGFAADVVRVLDELGISRAAVYGTSMGGRVAQWVAADHPGRVRAGARVHLAGRRPRGGALAGGAQGTGRARRRTVHAGADVHPGVAGRARRAVPHGR